jgi:predicted GTPase
MIRRVGWDTAGAEDRKGHDRRYDQSCEQDATKRDMCYGGRPAESAARKENSNRTQPNQD